MARLIECLQPSLSVLSRKLKQTDKVDDVNLRFHILFGSLCADKHMRLLVRLPLKSEVYEAMLDVEKLPTSAESQLRDIQLIDGLTSAKGIVLNPRIEKVVDALESPKCLCSLLPPDTVVVLCEHQDEEEDDDENDDDYYNADELF